MTIALPPEAQAIADNVRRFVDREVMPLANELEHADAFPQALLDQMNAMGLLGCTIAERFGGSGLSYVAYAAIVEELSRGWMSLGGMINTHIIDAYLLEQFGTPEQQERYLPRMARGEIRGAFTITEPNAGSDVQAIQATARREGDLYVLNGTKQFVTNGRRAGIFAVICKTDPQASPAYAGISILLVEPTTPGFTIVRDVEKLGYKGVDTVILRFDDARVPATQLLGAREGQGFRQALSALEVGRINVAARAVGLSQAAFEDAIRYAQQRQTFGVPIAEHQAIQFKLAEMATKIEAARLLTYKAAETKDRGERTDLEAGMAKLFATETALEVTMEAMRIFGGVGYTKDLRIERLYRDAPFMAIGEGTNEIQHIAIARALLRKYAI